MVRRGSGGWVGGGRATKPANAKKKSNTSRSYDWSQPIVTFPAGRKSANQRVQHWKLETDWTKWSETKTEENECGRKKNEKWTRCGEKGKWRMGEWKETHTVCRDAEERESTVCIEVTTIRNNTVKWAGPRWPVSAAAQILHNSTKQSDEESFTKHNNSTENDHSEIIIKKRKTLGNKNYKQSEFMSLSREHSVWNDWSIKFWFWFVHIFIKDKKKSVKRHISV